MSERSTTTDTPLRAELHLRGDTYGGFGPQEMRERAEHLATDGTFVDALETRQWPRVGTRTENRRSAAMETYEEFQVWAERNDFSLEPGFQQRPRGFVGLDEVEDVVVFPTVALALYDDRELQAVFPCSDGERTYSVESALAAFERGDESWFTRFDPVVTERDETRRVQENLIAD